MPLSHPEPQIRSAPALKIAGLRRRHDFGDHMFVELAHRWEEFGPMIAAVAHPKSAASFGLCFGMTGARKRFDYLTGVEVATLDAIGQPFAGIDLRSKTYAVFPHAGHVSRLNETVAMAWDWLSTSRRTLDCDDTTEPTFLERYGESFDPETGFGDIEVWLPIKTS